jgi:peroxiredoxin-like protein
MQELPHHYTVTAQGTTSTSQVAVSSAGVHDIMTDAPAEFDGPGDQWTPEALLMAAVADCFILTFRAVARASKLDWHDISCEATGKLDRIERVTRFTDVALQVKLILPTGSDHSKAERLLHKAEENCLVTNSMSCEITLRTDIQDA